MSKFHTKGEISNNLLIKAIRERPALYGKTEENAGTKRKLWLEVTKLVFPKVWDSFTTFQQELAGIEVQTRWKNLRNSFTRELRHRRLDAGRGKPPGRRKIYMYFNDLKFLTGNCDTTNQNEDDNDNVILDSMDTEVEAEETRSDTYIDFNTYPTETETSKRELESVDSTFTNVENDDEQTEAATHFAMSLIPFLKNVPPERKIDCEIMVLKVMKKFGRRKKVRREPLKDPLTEEISQSFIKMENDC